MSTLTDEITAHLCNHFASGRRRDHLDREIAIVWRRDPIREPLQKSSSGRGRGAGRAAAGALGLDGHRARARRLGIVGGDELRARARFRPT